MLSKILLIALTLNFSSLAMDAECADDIERGLPKGGPENERENESPNGLTVDMVSSIILFFSWSLLLVLANYALR